MMYNYNCYNSKKYVEKLAKSFLLIFNHIIKGENIECQSSWRADNEYYKLTFYKNNISFGEIFSISFYIKDEQFDWIEYTPSIRIDIENCSRMTDMIKCEDFLLFIKKLLLPFDNTFQYYSFHSSINITDIPYLIKKLSIKEYDLSNDIKKFNI